MELSDPVVGMSKNVQILTEADYINRFLIQKREEHGEVFAWLSSFGWVLSGPIASEGISSPEESQDPVKVAYIHSRVETVLEIEEPVGRKIKCSPSFPLHKKNNRSEVGRQPLWKNDDRTQDDRKQAIAQAITLRKRFLGDGTLEDDNKGLIDEHMEVGAIKEENSSEQGDHMPNDVLVHSFSSTTMPECRVGFNPADSARNKSLHVIFGLKCSPLLVSELIQHHLVLEEETVPNKAVQVVSMQMQNRVYADDCLSEESGVDKFQQTKCEIIRSASMERRKWSGNNIICSEAGMKVLTTTSDTELDQKSIAPDTRREDQEWLTRFLRNFIASNFDPFGYISLFTIAGKISLPLSWKGNNDWDASYAWDLVDRTQPLGKDIVQVVNFQTPCWLGAVQDQDLHLQIDAFENAYACCLYICLKDSAHLIYSRGKVASLETITRTRLELQAVFGGATCADFIWQEIHIKVLAAHAWAESMTERHWLQKPAHSWTAWVANRVSITKYNSNHSSLTWRHCPGFLNPADLPRQGGKMSSRWSNGDYM